MTRESVLARTMVELADNLVDDFDIVDVLTLLADRCVEVLDASTAGIMLGGPDRQLQLMTSSNEAMRVVELFELQSAEGPCWDCFYTGRPVVNHDLTTAHERWPNFAPVAVAAGFLGSDAIPMRLRGNVIGALNLFRTERGSLSDDDVTVAQALADVATIAILQNRTSVMATEVNAQLSAALTSRIVIEQAKGIIAERRRVSIDAAFAALRRHARDHNLRLAELAKATVDGEFDPAAFDDPPARGGAVISGGHAGGGRGGRNRRSRPSHPGCGRARSPSTVVVRCRPACPPSPSPTSPRSVATAPHACTRSARSSPAAGCSPPSRSVAQRMGSPARPALRRPRPART